MGLLGIATKHGFAMSGGIQPAKIFVISERGPGCEPEDWKVAQREGPEKPRRKNAQQELLELRGKRPQAHVAAAFLFSAPGGEGPLHGTTDVCRWCGPGRPEYPSPAVLPPLGYYTL